MMIRICPYIMQVNSYIKIFNDLVHPREQLFEDRDAKLLQAIETVNREIPATDLLNNGDTAETVKCLLPIVEDVYNMPDLRPESGSERWIKYMTKHIQQATFHDLVSFPQLLKKFVRQMEKKGTDKVCVCFLMLLCVCPYANMIVSTYFNACVLMLLCMCPYSYVFVSLYFNVCPYAIVRMSLCYYVCVLTLSGDTKVGVWRHFVLENLCCGETLRFCF